MNKMLRASSLLLLLLITASTARAQLVANFTASPLHGCAPMVVNFTNTSTGSITNYQWTFGNGTTSILANPSTTYTIPGTYTVTLTVSGPGGAPNTKTITNIIVYPPPTVSFSFSNAIGCPPLTVPFSSSVTANAPGALTYSWDYGDGSTFGTSASPTHTYTASGVFSVTLTVTNGQGCITTYTQPNVITVHSRPTPGIFATQTTYCNLPANVSFVSTSGGTGGLGITWSFGDGGTGSGASVSHSYVTPGNFNVTITVVDGNGCTATQQFSNYISTQYNTASFMAPLSICVSDSTLDTLYTAAHRQRKISWATFTNTTSSLHGGTKWFFGDGTGDTGISVMHAYYAAGTDTVKMITQVGNCSDTVTQIITVNPNPVADFSFPDPCPAPAIIQYTSTGTPATSYAWSFTNGSGIAAGTSTASTYTVNGPVDTVTLITTNAFGCKDTIDRAVYIHPLSLPIFDSTDKQGCVPATKVFRCYNRFCGPFGAYAVTPCPPSSCPCYVPVDQSTWLWTFGDGSSSTSPFPSHTYLVRGSYLVTCTVTTLNGCVLRDSMYIPVDTQVHPTFIATPTTACVHSPVVFTNTTNNPDTSIEYHWYFGDAFEDGNHVTVTHGYDTMGTYSPTLISNNHGCFDTLIRPDYITVLGGTARFTDSIYCPPSITVKYINLSVGPVTSQLWLFGDGATSTALSPTHTYATTGRYLVTLITYSSASGCIDTCRDTIPVIPPPVMSFLASDTTVCKGDTLHLTGSYSGSGTPPVLYWDLYNASLTPPVFRRYTPFPSLQHVDTALTVTGYYTVTYVAIDTSRHRTCRDSVRKNNYIIVSRPTPGFSASPVIGCTPLLVTFIDTSSFTPGTASFSRAWTFGDGGTISNNAVTNTHTYTTAGIYTVRLIVTDWNGCADSVIKVAYIKARHPVAGFSSNGVNGCLGQPVSFSNSSTGATGLIYRWSFGDGDTSAAISPAHVYAAVGSYTIRLIATDSTGCSDTLTRVGYINVTKPVAGFTLSDTMAVCPPLVVNFTSTAVNAAAYDWNFGNGNTSVLTNPSASYPALGVFIVRQIVTDVAGCTDTATANVRVLGYAGALSYTPLSGCSPLTVLFSANISNVPALVWDFSDGTTLATSSRSASHTYLNPGAYLPKLLFSDSSIGCSSSSTGIDTIKVDGVIAGFKALPPCEKTITQLIDTSTSFFSPINYTLSRWDFGPAGIATGSPVQRLYPAAGTYSITLISTNTRGCRDTLTRDITIFPLPHVLAPPDTAVCIPDAIALSASGALSYTWSPGATLSCTACTSTVAAPTAPTLYIVTGTDTNGCANRDTVRVGIQTKSTFVTTASGEICLGQHFQLIAAGATLYSWSPAATLDNADAASPIATPTVNTTYIVTGREGSCLADTHSVHVVVRPLPVVDAGGDLKVVAGNFILLQASGSGITRVEWGADASLSCLTCYAPEARPKVSSVYRITAYNEYGCSSTDSVRVVVLCDGSQLFIPNTFTPNGDGLNDMFYARGQGIDHINSMRVYSRWGELMYEGTNLQVNDERSGWNGTHGGRILNPDVYVYVIEATCDTGEPIKFKGDITLIR